MEKLSIIVPVYNVEKYIGRCMESLLNQTYKNIEIILINDGSTDKSGEMCDKYALQDNRVTVFHQKNEGVSSARNTGIKNATGKYITFVDPDDWVELDMYENIISKFNDEIDAVFCTNVEEYETETGKKAITRKPDISGVVSGRDALRAASIKMRSGYFVAVWNKVFKRDTIVKANIYFEDYKIAEDELWLTKFLPTLNRVYLLPEPYYHWFQRKGSALKGKKTYKVWKSLLNAKIEVSKQVSYDKELKFIAESRVYNDIFPAVCNFYLESNKKVSKEFLHKIKPFEKKFYKSKEFSKLKKIKVFILKWLVLLSMPKVLVEKIAKLLLKKKGKKYGKNMSSI